MGSGAGIRWSERDSAWIGAVGEPYEDRSGRARRREVYLRYPDGRKIARSEKKAAMTAFLSASKSDLARVLSFEELAEVWTTWQEENKKVEPESLAKNRMHLGYLLGFKGGILARKPINQISASDLDQVVESWRARGCGPAYINKMIGVAVACFGWAARRIRDRGQGLPEYLLEKSPFAAYPREELSAAPEKYATRKEIALFFNFVYRRIYPEKCVGGPREGEWIVEDRVTTRCPRRDLTNRYQNWLDALWLMRAIASTGARPSELCNARWKDFDPTKRLITLLKHKTSKKTKRPRLIVLPPGVVRHLLRKRGEPEDYLFPLQGKNKRTQIILNWVIGQRDEAHKAGLPIERVGPNRFHLYRLRHTRISDGLMSGIPTSHVAAATGTSEAMIRATYGHILEETIRETADAMVTRRC